MHDRRYVALEQVAEIVGHPEHCYDQAGATLLRARVSERILPIFLVVLRHVASNFGSLARLQAAMVIVNCAPSLSVPRSIVWAIEPTVLAHPKGSSIFFRRFCDTA